MPIGGWQNAITNLILDYKPKLGLNQLALIFKGKYHKTELIKTNTARLKLA